MQNTLYTVSEINHHNNMLVLHLPCLIEMIPFGQGDEVTVRKEVRKSARSADMQSLVEATGQTLSPVEKFLREDYVHDDRGWVFREAVEHWEADGIVDCSTARVAITPVPAKPHSWMNEQDRLMCLSMDTRRQANIQIITNAQRMYRVLHWLVEARKASDLSTLLFNIEVAEELLEEIRTGK